MTRNDRLRYAAMALEELSRSETENNPIQDLLWLALYSPDTTARLSALRALAGELDANSVLGERQLARWDVIRIPPQAKAA